MARYRWTILALGTGAQTAYSAVFLGIPVLAPALQREYDLDLTEVGLAIAAANAGSVFTLLAWGLLADRVGERFVLAAGLAGCGAGLLVAAFAPSFGVLVLALTLGGAAGASVNAASGRAVMSWFRKDERGFALGIRQTALPIGGLLAALLLPPIEAAGGVRAGLIALAAGCLAAAIAGASGLREAPHEEGELTDIGHPVRDPRMWQLSIGSALVLAAQISILSFLILFLHAERGLSTAEAAAVFAVIQALGAAARILTGRWSDRLKARIAPLRKLALGLTVTLAAAAALLSAPLALLLPVFVAAGALSLSWNGLSFTAAAELAGRRRAGAALGFQQTALAITSAAAPPAFAAVVEAGSWSLAYGLAAAMPVAGIAVMRQLSL
ncbi:MAG TPA: MFS transporter [Gaiellaceae bacterium]|nr:MFS transporter [Gaiellaceae bacterium]